jgi:hypothetical protein
MEFGKSTIGMNWVNQGGTKEKKEEYTHGCQSKMCTERFIEGIESNSYVNHQTLQDRGHTGMEMGSALTCFVCLCLFLQ